MKLLKGILIDPELQTIIELETDASLESMYELIECSAVDVGRSGLRFLPSAPDDDVWFDDEGVFSGCKHCFQLPGWVPLIGKALIIGYDDNGNCVSHHLTKSDIESLRNNINFMMRKEDGV